MEIRDTIGYFGKLDVSLSVDKNPYRITFKNNGTDKLFNSIAQSLTGTVTDKTPIPSYIDIVVNDSSILRAPVKIVSRQYQTISDPTGVEVSYLGSLGSYDVAVNPDFDASLKIRLLDQSRKNVLAIIESPTDMCDAIRSLKPGVNISLKWSLIFANGEYVKKEEVVSYNV